MRLIYSGYLCSLLFSLLALGSCKSNNQTKGNAAVAVANIDSISIKIQAATDLIEAGSSDKAIRLLEKETDLNPLSTRLLNNLSMAYLSNGDTISAIKTFQQSLAVDSTQPDATYQLGFLFAANRDERALSIANVLIKQQGLNKEQLVAQGHYLKGLYFVNTGKTMLGIHEFDESIINNYTFLDAYIEKGIALFEMNKFDESLKILSKSVEIDRYQADVYFWMAKNHEKLGNTEDAKYYYQQTLDLAPDFESAKTGLSSLSNNKNK
jgi:tetratricopeptide (TPR) repeat protein